MKTMLQSLALGAALTLAPALHAADYVIDTQGAHASVQFRIKHLGYSWLVGRFNDFEGTFSYDADTPNDSKVQVTIDTTSLDSNHAERDKHLRGKDFLHVDKYPEATFVSTSYNDHGDGTGELKGDLTLHGVTQPVTIDVEKVGEGKDPWGGYRAGFSGTTRFALKDFGIDYNLGPASTHVTMMLNIEGIRQ